MLLAFWLAACAEGLRRSQKWQIMLLDLFSLNEICDEPCTTTTTSKFPAHTKVERCQIFLFLD
jgi:hypothetical protein